MAFKLSTTRPANRFPGVIPGDRSDSLLSLLESVSPAILPDLPKKVSQRNAKLQKKLPWNIRSKSFDLSQQTGGNSITSRDSSTHPFYSRCFFLGGVSWMDASFADEVLRVVQWLCGLEV